MSEHNKLRVLVRTLPLENGNYGGLLQAYALQRVLGELGTDAVTDRATSFSRDSFQTQLKGSLRKLLLALGRHHAGWLDRAARELDAPFVAGFADRHLATVSLFDAQGQVVPEVVDKTDAFVAGSDQVWRQRYADPRSYLFDFLPEHDPRPKVSYAASFGKGDLDEYSPGLIRETAQLAARLTGLSVREASAVRLVADNWGLVAEQHIDPTFLLTRESYQRLASSSTEPFATNRVVDYVLDDESESRDVVSQVAAIVDASRLSLIPPVPRSYQELRKRPDRFRRPSVEHWLGAIGAARIVVTDSFHGTAFSIIHNVPFISVVNRVRGAARFESLLGMFGLEDRLVEPGTLISRDLVESPIEWDSVNQKISGERERSMNYLKKALLVDARTH